MRMKSSARNLFILGALCVVAIIAMALQPPIPQPLDYHAFADQRTLFGVPNFWNVVSNVPFVFVGIAGLILVARDRYPGGLRSLRTAYICFFILVTCVCFGSSYYHWASSNQTLAWDRLPIALAFMAFVAVIVGENINERVGLRMLLPLMLIGAISVWYWRYTEIQGQGDLRLYLLVQFLPLIVLPFVLWLFPSQFSGVGFIWLMFAGYALAKIFEELDASIFAAGHLISGHSLKHLVAAAAMSMFLIALQRRRLKVVT